MSKWGHQITKIELLGAKNDSVHKKGSRDGPVAVSADWLSGAFEKCAKARFERGRPITKALKIDSKSITAKYQVITPAS